MVSLSRISLWLQIPFFLAVAVNGQNVGATRDFLNSSTSTSSSMPVSRSFFTPTSTSTLSSTWSSTLSSTSSSSTYSDTYVWSPLLDTGTMTSTSSICIVYILEDGSTSGSCPDIMITHPATTYSSAPTTLHGVTTTTTDDGHLDTLTPITSGWIPPTNWLPIPTTTRSTTTALLSSTSITSNTSTANETSYQSTPTPTTVNSGRPGDTLSSATPKTTKSSLSSEYWHQNSTSSTFSTSGHYSNSSTIPTASWTSDISSSTWRSSLFPTSTSSSSPPDGCTSCETLTPGETQTVFSLLPNTNTITITISGNSSFTLPSVIPDPTDPVYCPDTCATPATLSNSAVFSTSTTEPTGVSTTGSQLSTIEVTPTQWPIPPTGYSSTTTITTRTAVGVTSPVITVIVTSKNPVTEYTSVQFPTYDSSATKQTVTSISTDTYQWKPITQSTFDTATNTPIPMTNWVNYDLSATTAITQILDGITMIVYNTVVVIGKQTVDIGTGTETITEQGDVFTIDPTQVVGPWLIVNVPTYTGGVFIETAKPTTTVLGVPVSVGTTAVNIGGTTYAIGPGATDTTIVEKGQTITIGTGGVEFSGTTITPPAQSTNFVLVGGEIFTAIGSTLAVIGGTTITYGAGIERTTDVISGHTITIGPSGLTYDGSTIGGTAHGSGTQYGVVGGLSVTEVGSTLAIVNGHTITVGPGSLLSTTVVDGQTVIAGPSGITIGGATLTYPLVLTTQAITAGGITFSEVGSSLAVIGGTTYSFGPGATPTTKTYNGQTISIGPGGIGFATTTFTAATSSPTAAHTSTKGGAGSLRPAWGVWSLCMAACIGYLM